MNNHFFQVFYERKDEFFKAVLEHIQISFYALVIALIIAIPLGIYLTYKKQISEIIIGLTAVIQTIPSLANYTFTCITRVIDSSYGNW